MQFRDFAQLLALVSAVSAAPTPNAPLSADAIILLHEDGTSTVVNEAEYKALQARGIVPFEYDEHTPYIDHAEYPFEHVEPPHEPANVTVPGDLTRRAWACEASNEIQVMKDEHFLNWDIAIGPITENTGGTILSSISTGKTIGNSLTVAVGVGYENVASGLSASLEISYAWEWTTTETSTVTFTVPAGKWGIIVSNPYTRRLTGNVWDGCKKTFVKDAFLSDTYTSKTWGQLKWVTGALRLCTSDTYPIKKCIGEGYHY